MIYHYTSIETLALILDTKKIRFTRLDLVNDPEEALNEENIDIRKNIMVSCWTKESEENIPMWHMYTNKNGSGVRIGVEDEIIETNRMVSNNCWLSKIQKVNYSNNINCSLIKNNLIKLPFNDKYILYPGGIATNKKKVWSFESEKRFVIVSSGVIRGENIDNNMKIKIMIENKFKRKYKYIRVNRKLLNNMNIIIGPGCTKGENIVINALCEKYHIVNVKQSNLKI